MPAGKVEEKDLLPLRSCTSVPLASSFILHPPLPPPPPRTHAISSRSLGIPSSVLLSQILPQQPASSIYHHLISTRFAYPLPRTPPDICLVRSLKISLPITCASSTFSFFFFFHNERLVLPFILLVSRDESTFVTNYIVRYAIVFFFFHIFLIYDRSLTKRIKNSRANY